MAPYNDSRALHVVSACAAGFIYFGVRAAGHVGMQMQMGAQNGPSGGMEVFFRRGKWDRCAEGHAAGQGRLDGADKKEKDHESSANSIQNAEPKEEKAKNQQKCQCAVCGRRCELPPGSRRSCPACGGPSFEVRRSPTRFSPLEALVGGRPEAGQTRHGPDSEENVGKGKTCHGLHGRGEVRVGSGSQMKAIKQIRVAKRAEREVGRLLGRSKVTCSGTRVWTSRPCLVNMLRTTNPQGAPEAEGKGHGARAGTFSKELETMRAEQRPKGSSRAALEIAKNKVLMVDAVESLKRDFWSESNREAQASKRKLFVELAQAVGGEWWSPPLTEDVVVGVAAALKAAGLKTAASLINDLKLWRVETGHQVTDGLARLLSLAKKSVSRNLGPVKRALEVKITEVDNKMWQCDRWLEVCEPILAYAWAVVFMLRCAEVAAVRWIHVSADKDKKVITLKIPISKMDQSGWGVRRTLGCCGLRKCSWACAWKVWSEISRRATSKSEFVFVDEYEGTKSTRKMTLAWKDKLKAEMSGHSARRSGAMMYVRAGLPIQEVAFL